ncbi:MAG: type III polyketide synthase [Bacteroidota bacterium]
MSAYITSIGTANPKNRVSQNEVHRFMTRAHQLNPEESDKLRALYRASGISYRYSVLDDYAKEDGFEFYENSENLEPFPSTKSRNLLFKKNALALSISAIEDCLPYGFDKTKISHLITVSCTGLYAPGLDIELVNALDLPLTIQRTAINFMGCYAAFNALKVANVICDSDSEANVLIVCTELCSIHFQKEKADDNLLANALFGDGSAAVLVSNNPDPGQPALAMNKFACDLLPVGIEEMAWNLGDFGFEMRLSTYVPDVIDQGIDRLLDRLSVAKTSFEHYAIHPGGKKILNVVEQKLGISRSDNTAAHEILREYGNMSSPTVLFVLKRLMHSMDSSNQGDRIFSLAFGPGLTLESIVFQVTT